MRASTATQPSGPARTGLRSSSQTSGRSSARRAEPDDEIAESALRPPAARLESRQRAALPCRPHELVGVEVGQRREPEAGVADQLGECPTRPEGHERSEERILDDAGEQLGTAHEIRLDDDRAAHRLDCIAHLARHHGGRGRRRRRRSCAGPARPASRRPGTRACEPPRPPRRLCRRRDFLRRPERRRPRAALARRRAGASRPARSRSPRSTIARARCRGRFRPARTSCAGGSAQPLGVVGGERERPRRRFGVGSAITGESGSRRAGGMPSALTMAAMTGFAGV